MRPHRLSDTACLLAVVSLLACSATEPEVHSLKVVYGDDQQGVVSEPLPFSLVVTVSDSKGRPVTGVDVEWSVMEGDGVINGEWETDEWGAPSGDPRTSVITTTNADGVAAASFTPLSFGSMTVAAAERGMPESAVSFTVDASDPLAELFLVSGDNQEVETSEQIGEAFVVGLVDGRGDPVPNVAVLWRVTSGQGGLHGNGLCGDPPTVCWRTGSDGRTGSTHSGVTFRPTQYGLNQVQASVDGVTGSPVTFTVEATVQNVFLWLDYSPPGFHPADVTVPVGATVQFSGSGFDSAHIVSTSAPSGGAPIDSGVLGSTDRYVFVPDVAGTWEFVDEVSGFAGTLTATGS